MTIFHLKIRKRELRLCLISRKYTSRNWYQKNEIGGNYTPKTTVHSFGLIWLGRVVFYYTYFYPYKK